MNAEVTTDVETQALTLCKLLKEYVEKLAILFQQSSTLPDARKNPGPLACWLDQAERMKRPFQNILSRASQLLEHAELESITHDELLLRIAESEIHFHHVLRQLETYETNLKSDPRLKDRIGKHRYLAGLSVG